MSELPLQIGRCPDPDTADPAERAVWYHHRTKHHLRAYAAALGYLDWATQPDPFRTFAGAPAIDLPLAADSVTTVYADLYRPGTVPPQPLNLQTIAILFELSLGLSAWKEYRGSRWALRCNPSSGNLHPTEGYAAVPDLPGLSAGVYHYVSRDHRLERRCTLPPTGPVLVGLSSVHWREAWKYGERAYRYCQHDAGHAIAAVRYAAAALGWSVRLLERPSDDDVAALLGLDRSDDYADAGPAGREHPDVLLLVGPNLTEPAELPVGTAWQGRANRLGGSHVAWEAIDLAAQATRKPRTSDAPPPMSDVPESPAHRCVTPAATLIRQRRSCLALDGRTGLTADAFFAVLDRLLPRANVPPWDVLAWRPHLHPVMFVHRVRGLTPGLYVLERDPAVHDRLRAAVRDAFAWEKPAGCPDHLPLYFLAGGDHREVARVVSCHQEIASDGAFSLGMLAEFGGVVRRGGAWWYRRLFWEAGVLGQVLYLEAEAAGVRGTGIGCYFDDPFHELLGLADDEFQSLYHFTMGGPVEDTRLRTIAPYAHRGR